MYFKGKIEGKSGITIISLIVAIIILLILAAVTLNLVTGEEGIIARAINAKNQTMYAIEKEKIQTAIPAAINIESNLELDFEKLRNELGGEDDVEIINRGRYFVVDFKDNGRKYRVNKDDYSVVENYDSTYFGGFKTLASYKDDIKTVQFVKYINVPEGAVQADLSKDNNGSIIGWLEPNEDEPDRYDFYIGSEKTILAQAGSCNSLFNEWDNVENIYFDNFDTWEVTNMTGMFKKCHSLKSINPEYLEMTNVISIYDMFWLCNSIEGTMNLSSWNIEKIEDMGRAFFEVSANEIIMPGKNTSVKSIVAMFQGCQAEKIDISGLDTINVTNMRCLFHGCPNLKHLEISSFCFDNVENLEFFINYMSRNDAIVYVKDENAQRVVLKNRTGWTTDNVRIK